MNLDDIAGPAGPYWEPYEDYRDRNNLYDFPDTVPFWFLLRIAHDRVAAARVALEKVGAEGVWTAWRGLKEVEEQLQGAMHTPQREAIVLGILGGEELEAARELAERENAPKMCPEGHEEFSVPDCKTCRVRADSWMLDDTFRRILSGPEISGLSSAEQQDRLKLGLRDTLACKDAFVGWQTRFPRLVEFWGGKRVTLDEEFPEDGMAEAVVNAWMGWKS